MTIFCLTIIILFLLFFIFFKNEGIIYDQGFHKIILFSLGLILYYVSNFFATYSDYTKCYLNFFFKHTGILLFMGICYTIITLNYEIGKKITFENSKYNIDDDDDNDNDRPNFLRRQFETNETSKKDLRRPSQSSFRRPSQNSFRRDSIFRKYNRNSYNINRDNSFNHHRPLSIKDSIMSNKINKRNSNISKNGEIDRFNETSYKIIKKISSQVLEIIVLFIILTLSIILVIIFSDKDYEKNITQQLDGHWYYQCQLEKPDIIYSSIEYFLLFITLIKGNVIGKYERIFTITRFITLSTKFGIVFGPLIDVRNKYILEYIKIHYIIIMYILIFFLYFFRLLVTYFYHGKE